LGIAIIVRRVSLPKGACAFQQIPISCSDGDRRAAMFLFAFTPLFFFELAYRIGLT
jgi:hypothetical protein